MNELDIGAYELIIKSIKPADAGIYQCVTAADNGFKETFKEVELFVECEYSCQAFKNIKNIMSYTDVPRLLLEQTNFKSSVGEEIHITCVVEGFPKPNVFWTRFAVV